MKDKIDSLRRAVEFGIANGKRNLIVDLDVLAVLFEERKVKQVDYVRRERMGLNANGCYPDPSEMDQGGINAQGEHIE